MSLLSVSTLVGSTKISIGLGAGCWIVSHCNFETLSSLNSFCRNPRPFFAVVYFKLNLKGFRVLLKLASYH